jgi:hypothetical protein
MTALSQREGIAARALEFTILAAARTGEVIGATWDEVDLEAKVCDHGSCTSNSWMFGLHRRANHKRAVLGSPRGECFCGHNAERIDLDCTMMQCVRRLAVAI